MARFGSADGDRALARLDVRGGVLSWDAARADFACHPGGDRRRGALIRLLPELVAALTASGALEEIEAGVRYRLAPAGRARARRAAAGEDEGYHAQHQPIGARAVIDRDGDLRTARGVDPAGTTVARLARLSDADGRPFLAPEELSAAHRLRADWEQGQAGLVRGSDWQAPPRGAAARPGSPGAAQASGIDARRRFERAIGALAPMLAAAVRAACLEETAFGEIERAQRWPARSGKLALKLGLAQLAAHYRGA